MAETSYPYHDQDVTDAEYSDFARDYAPNGVIKRSTDGGDLKVTADSTGMKVKVAAGRANVRGHRYRNSVSKDFTIPPKDTYPRVDLVVVRSEYGSVNDAHIVVKKGTPTPSPTVAKAPDPEQTADGVWEEPLAEVAVSASAVTITAANVTDKRRLITPGELPPIMHFGTGRGGAKYDGSSRRILKTGSAVALTTPAGAGTFPWPEGAFPGGLASISLTPGDAATPTTQLIIAGGTDLTKCVFVALTKTGAAVAGLQVRVDYAVWGW